jgi:hypothetical protein
MEAIRDGILTEDELRQIEARRHELGLTRNDLKRLHVGIYQEAIQRVSDDSRLSPDEEQSLERLATYLDVPWEALERNRRQLVRFRLLYQIEHGDLPALQIANIILRKGELVHWSEPASILEERVLRRGYVGGSSGFSFRIARGVSYRVGAHRGQLVSETGVVPVSIGDFILTSKRAIFRGDRKAFNTAWDKILDVHFYSDGIRLTTTSRSKPTVIQFQHDGAVEIVGALIAAIVNRFSP